MFSPTPTPTNCAFYTQQNDKITIRIRLTPNAAQNKLGDLYHDANNQTWLKASVTTIPEKGKANKALIALLSKALKTPKSNIEIISGDTDRNKTITITNPHDALLTHLHALTQ